MRSREAFNQAAKLYDEVRPTYPNELIDFIVKKTNITPDYELLEIAPGTGQATRKFVDLGFTIHAVELGDKLAELLLLNMKGKNVTVDISSFEDWIPKVNKKYKLIYCATAWHWIDKEVKYQKAYDLLEEDGYLALIWNNAIGSPDNALMDEAYKLLFSYHKETPHSTKPKSESQLLDVKAQSIEGIEESGHFKMDDYIQVNWSITQPKEVLIKGFFTQSSYLSLSDQEKEEVTPKITSLFNQMEDELDTLFRSTVYLAKKVKQ